MKAFIALFMLLISSAYAQTKTMKAFDDPAFKADLEKMTPEERKKAAMLMLMMMEVEAGVEKKIYYRSIAPQILMTGKEGLKFKTRIPFLGVAMADWDFSEYKENPSLRIPEYSSEKIISPCMGCFSGKKFKDNRLTFTLYPAGSEFVIESFVGVPGRISAFVRDNAGKRIDISEYDLRDIIDGGSGGFQNEELVLIDLINPKPDVVNIPVKIEEVGYEYFQKGVDEHWDFPPFKMNVRQSFPKEDFESWLNYAATGFLDYSEKVKISNIRKTEYDTVFDITTSMRTFVILHYAKLITPYLEIKDHGTFNDQYRNRWKDQPLVLGEKVEDFLKKWKATVKAPPMPEGEERKKIADQLYKEKEAEMKKKLEDKK